ncbi:hypothetical protein [Lacisediminihabitans sp.]|uniref:hypothetical protein n=1 Tax=Lacisediminihabitans sp. TaxID=2787631 RepID=UPI00374DB706
MTFLPMTTGDELSPGARSAVERRLEFDASPITALESTLLANPASFAAYLEWYALREEIAPWIGERAVSLFSYAISDENDCEVCSLAFRKVLVDSGDDPDHPEVTETEQLLIDWGRLIVRSPHGIPDEFYARLEAAFSPERRLTVLAFAGQMIAVNLIATVGRVPLDPALAAYRRPGRDV